MYRPLKDLDGIPGAKNLTVCLTGYLRQDRDDIMVIIFYTLSYWLRPGAYTHCDVSVLDFTIIYFFRQWLSWWVHSFLSRWWQPRLLILYATNLKVCSSLFCIDYWSFLSCWWQTRILLCSCNFFDL